MWRRARMWKSGLANTGGVMTECQVTVESDTKSDLANTGGVMTEWQVTVDRDTKSDDFVSYGYQGAGNIYVRCCLQKWGKITDATTGVPNKRCQTPSWCRLPCFYGGGRGHPGKGGEERAKEGRWRKGREERRGIKRDKMGENVKNPWAVPSLRSYFYHCTRAITLFWTCQRSCIRCAICLWSKQRFSLLRREAMPTDWSSVQVSYFSNRVINV